MIIHGHRQDSDLRFCGGLSWLVRGGQAPSRRTPLQQENVKM